MLKNKIPIAAAIAIALFVVLALAVFTNNNLSTAASNNLDTAPLQKPIEGDELNENSLVANKSEEVESHTNILDKVTTEEVLEPTTIDLKEAIELLKEIQSKQVISDWVYTRVEKIQFDDYPELSANGDPLPNNYVDECWRHLNAEDLVDKYVTLRKTSEGQILQQVIYKDGQAWNSTQNNVKDLVPFRFDFDYGGLLGRALEYADRNPHIAEQTELDGRPVIRIVSTEKFPEPVVVFGFDQLAVGSIHERFYDLSTGYLVQTITRSLLEDGSERLDQQMKIEIRNDLTPPEEIVKMLGEGASK